VGGELRMTEEFTRVALEWDRAARGPAPEGRLGPLRRATLPDWEVGLVEIRFEPPPHPLSLSELRRAGSYRLPPVVRTLRPRLARRAAATTRAGAATSWRKTAASRSPSRSSSAGTTSSCATFTEGAPERRR
jgi:hypothetical protein